MITFKVSRNKEVQRKFEKAKKELDRIHIATHKGLARYGKSFARKIIAVKTGHARENIAVISFKTRSRITSTTNKPSAKGWPYHKWLDEQPGITNHGKTYSQSRHRGVPGYMKWTYRILAERAKVEPKRDVKRAISMTFG